MGPAPNSKFISMERLADNGENWVSWKTQIKSILGSNSLLKHIDGTARQPPAPIVFQPNTVPTRDQLKQQDEEEERMEKYLAREEAAKTQIFLSISKSLMLSLQSLQTAQEVWNAVCKEFENKPKIIQIDLQKRMTSLKCREGDDVRAHLETLTNMHERLAGMGTKIADEDFFNIILSSLPDSYDIMINSLTTTMAASKQPLSPSDLISIIKSEYDRRKIRKNGGEVNSGNGSNQALAIAIKNKPAINNPNRNVQSQLTCSNPNCNRTGHVIADCWRKGGGKEGQGPRFFGRFQGRGRGGARGRGGSQGSGNRNANVAETKDSYAFSASTKIESNINIVEVWDSGANTHMSPYREQFSTFKDLNPPQRVRTADNTEFLATGIGSLKIKVPNGNESTTVTLLDVLYSPALAYTLISITRCTSKGFTCTFTNGECVLRSPKGKICGKIKNVNGLFQTRRENNHSHHSANTALTLNQFHARMGHIAPSSAKEMIDGKMVEGIELIESPIEFCEACVKGKITQTPVERERRSELCKNQGEKVHTDVWGPSEVQTIGGNQWYISFTDDFSRETTTYLMRHKSEALSKYKMYEAMLKRQRGIPIKRLQSDSGGEYTSNEFKTHLALHGTIQQLTVHDTPQHNGVAERLNRTLVEHIRSMLIAADLPKFLWGECLQHATYLKNRTPTRALKGKTPYELVHDKKPNLKNLAEWGGTVYVKVIEGGKLSPRAKEGRWVGFGSNEESHRIYWEERRTVTVERNVIFPSLSQPPILQSHESEKKSTTNNPEDIPLPVTPPTPIQEVESPDEEIPQTVRRGTRMRKPSAYARSIKQGVGTAEGRDGQRAFPVGMQIPEEEPEASIAINEGYNEEEIMDLPDLDLSDDYNPINNHTPNQYFSFVADLVTERKDLHENIAMLARLQDGVPATLEETMRGPDWHLWKPGFLKELESLRRLNVWEVVDKPEGANVVGTKWSLRLKHDAEGNIKEYRARLVAQGFSQTFGVDYEETFSPITRLASLRFIAAMAARNNWAIEQMDVNNAYLNAELTETVYIQQPPGFPQGPKDKVLKLNKALYGLKQSGRAWYHLLCSTMTGLGYSISLCDPAVFFKRDEGEIVIIAAAVDDLTITGDPEAAVFKAKDDLNKSFKMKDLGELSWLLNMEVKRNKEKRTISFAQRSYIDLIIKRFHLQDASPVTIPMNPHTLLKKSQQPRTQREKNKMHNVPYREAIGSLMWAAMGTRPDIAFAVSFLSQFMENPEKPHWEAVKRVLRYLKGTREFRLTYGEGERGMAGFSDADWGQQYDRHSISGYCFIIDGGAFSWSSSKQKLITLSSAEAEFVAITYAAKEASWIHHFISEIFRPIEKPIKLYSDNQSAIIISKNNKYQGRTKHIDIRYKWVFEIVTTHKLVDLQYRPTDRMTADIFTKPLPRPKLLRFISDMGLTDITDLDLRGSVGVQVSNRVTVQAPTTQAPTTRSPTTTQAPTAQS
jgi:transposase InsO family protein